MFLVSEIHVIVMFVFDIQESQLDPNFYIKKLIFINYILLLGIKLKYPWS